MKILLTGMSGTGKSTALRELAGHGHRVVDTDTEAWSEWVTLSDGTQDWIWRESEIDRLLSEHGDGALFVAGCKSNQGVFYSMFDQVVLLSAPLAVILERLARRTDNPYGKSLEDRARIQHDLITVEPLLRRTATVEIDATARIDDVVAQLDALCR